jgi:hypothetical protein
MQNTRPPESSRVISDHGLKAVSGGYRIDIRLPWYRSLPVSTVEVGAIQIDGQPVDLSTVTFELEGQRRPLAAMPDMTNVVWYVLDSAYLNVPHPSAASGSKHDVVVTLNLYPPYIPGLKRMTRDRLTLTAQ